MIERLFHSPPAQSSWPVDSKLEALCPLCGVTSTSPFSLPSLSSTLSSRRISKLCLRVVANLTSFLLKSQLRQRSLSPAVIMAQVKPDPDAMYIKPDPDSKEAVLADLEDDDIYEDAGDLDFSASAQNVWLSRLPQQLWDHWATMDENADDDEEIEIGTIRIEGEPGDLKRVCFFSVKSSSARILTLF